MIIYICHSSAFDYQQQLYLPIKAATLAKQHQILLPHEKSDKPICSKAMIEQADIVICECSLPSTGMGIELGWANSMQKPILAMHQQQVQPSTSIDLIADACFAYHNSEHMLDIVESFITRYQHHQGE